MLLRWRFGVLGGEGGRSCIVMGGFIKVLFFWDVGEINMGKLIPQGYGQVVFPSNYHIVAYEGQWEKGMFDGQGHMKWSNGN